jgi:hypothetical protein
MIVTQMIREPDYKITDPKFDDICALMIRVTQDEGEPLITLRKTSVESGTDYRSELWIARLNVCDNASLRAGWFGISRATIRSHWFLQQVPQLMTFFIGMSYLAFLKISGKFAWYR